MGPNTSNTLPNTCTSSATAPVSLLVRNLTSSTEPSLSGATVSWACTTTIDSEGITLTTFPTDSSSPTVPAPSTSPDDWIASMALTTSADTTTCSRSSGVTSNIVGSRRSSFLVRRPSPSAPAPTSSSSSHNMTSSPLVLLSLSLSLSDVLSSESASASASTSHILSTAARISISLLFIGRSSVGALLGTPLEEDQSLSSSATDCDMYSISL